MIEYQRALAAALRDPQRGVPGIDPVALRRFFALAERKRARLRRIWRFGGVRRRS